MTQLLVKNDLCTVNSAFTRAFQRCMGRGGLRVVLERYDCQKCDLVVLLKNTYMVDEIYTIII
jgi:hypothetical protein